MRALAWTAGALLFCSTTFLSWSRFARPLPRVTVITGAVPTPAAASAPSSVAPDASPASAPARDVAENPAWDPSAAPPDPATASPAAPGPSTATTEPAPALPEPSPVLPRDDSPDRAPSRHARKKTTAPAVPPEPAPDGEPAAAASGEPEARCLECGKPATSWIEVDGKRFGYCRKHYSKLDHSRTRKTAAAPSPDDGGGADPAAEGGTGGREEKAGAVQCRGRTKSGARCRRKTSDPSGYCYQHRKG